uniref:phospholipid scramblase-related protein n=1 Tax=Flavobacterium sp. TaxID=239 RepID=UPI004048EA4F
VFKQKVFSFGVKFEIHDANDRHLCTLQGKWTGWDFKFLQHNKEIATVSKKWAGIGKEFFTSADNYVLNIDNSVGAEDPIRQLILAAIMCIDMVFKE